MSGTDCGELKRRIQQGLTLTAAEFEHVEGCEACLEVWLDATVTQTLNAKPAVQIPSDFAARVAAALPEKRTAASRGQDRSRHWGLMAAVLVAAVVLVAVSVVNPVNVNTWTGVVFLVLVVTEIAGIALWLGARGARP